MMKYLAHWIYTGKDLQQGVKESTLVAKTTEYLRKWRFDDPEDAKRAAHEFVEHCCNGRAWVFTDTGTTRTGEKLYQFTHQTFLEFFTAAYLKSTFETTDKLLDVLQPKIASEEWDNVAQLAFQIKSKDSEVAADELLSALVKQVRGTDQHCHNMLSFAVRCLEFIVPSPTVVRNIAKACIDYALLWGLERMSKKDLGGDELKASISSGPSVIIDALLCATAENRETVANSLEEQITEWVINSSDDEAKLALEIGLGLLEVDTRTGRREIVDFWSKVSKQIKDKCSNSIEALLPKDALLCRILFFKKMVMVADLVRWHGIESLFFSYCLILGGSLPPIADSLASLVLRGRVLSLSMDHLKDIGHLIVHYSPPWIKKGWHGQGSLTFSPFLVEGELSGRQVEELQLDTDALFGAFILFAALLEWHESTSKQKTLRIGEYLLPKPLRWILFARFKSQHIDEARDEINRCGFSVEQKEYVWKWIRREMNFVEAGE